MHVEPETGPAGMQCLSTRLCVDSKEPVLAQIPFTPAELSGLQGGLGEPCTLFNWALCYQGGFVDECCHPNTWPSPGNALVNGGVFEVLQGLHCSLTIASGLALSTLTPLAPVSTSASGSAFLASFRADWALWKEIKDLGTALPGRRG